jgi:hypothetical protein
MFNLFYLQGDDCQKSLDQQFQPYKSKNGHWKFHIFF